MSLYIGDIVAESFGVSERDLDRQLELRHKVIKYDKILEILLTTCSVAIQKSVA
jgi:hypothetical protein